VTVSQLPPDVVLTLAEKDIGVLLKTESVWAGTELDTSLWKLNVIVRGETMSVDGFVTIRLAVTMGPLLAPDALKVIAQV
jgi:hypothetical protein